MEPLYQTGYFDFSFFKSRFPSCIETFGESFLLRSCFGLFRLIDNIGSLFLRFADECLGLIAGFLCIDLRHIHLPLRFFKSGFLCVFDNFIGFAVSVGYELLFFDFPLPLKFFRFIFEILKCRPLGNRNGFYHFGCSFRLKGFL